MPDITVYHLNLENRSARISPLWFGHNLEHTRSCVWQGISAQLVRNRKFHGIPQRNGVASGWYPIGPEQTHFALEERGAYTARFDPQSWRRRKETLCQRICSVTEDTSSGIGQAQLPVVGGRNYEVRVALRSDRTVTATVRLVDHGTSLVNCETFLEVEGGDWREFSFTWELPQGHGEVDLEIRFEQTAKFYVGSVSLLPADNFHGLRSDVVDLLREIGCPVLRWPGGNFAGDYRWQDGLLPVDRRSPLAAHMPIETLGHTGGYDCHEIGTDEFIALCRTIDAEPYFTINPTWEGPEVAAAWVEYCNGSVDTKWGGMRADRGHPEPYSVKYWSLGNEFGQSHMEGPSAPSDYARHLRPHAEAMKAVDASIELVASGDWRHDEWYTDCLTDLGDAMDHVSHHHYTGGESPAHMEDYVGAGALEDFRAVTTTANCVILPELKRVHDKLRVHEPAGRRIGITFDEWNVWHAWHRVPGVVEGIHHASMLNMLCREADQLGLSIGCFFEPVNEGAILVEPDRAYLPAAGKVFSLFKAHHGNTRLELGRQEPQADVDGTASLDEQTGQVVLTVVNRNPQEQRRIRLILPDNRWKARGTLLSSENFLPASDFNESGVTFESCEEGLELDLPPHSIARFTASSSSV